MGTGTNHHIIFNRLLISGNPAFAHSNGYGAPCFLELNNCVIENGFIELL